jgi:hypothetical protein
MKFETRMDFTNYSDEAMKQVVSQSPGKPFYERTKDGQKEIGKIVSAERVDDSTVVIFKVDTDTPIDRLLAELEDVHNLKKFRLEKTDPETIEYPVLECEILDANTMIQTMKLDVPHADKIAVIKGVYEQTTSKTIFELVETFFEEEGVEIERTSR